MNLGRDVWTGRGWCWRGKWLRAWAARQSTLRPTAHSFLMLHREGDTPGLGGDPAAKPTSCQHSRGSGASLTPPKALCKQSWECGGCPWPSQEFLGARGGLGPGGWDLGRVGDAEDGDSGAARPSGTQTEMFPPPGEKAFVHRCLGAPGHCSGGGGLGATLERTSGKRTQANACRGQAREASRGQPAHPSQRPGGAASLTSQPQRDRTPGLPSSPTEEQAWIQPLWGARQRRLVHWALTSPQEEAPRKAGRTGQRVLECLLPRLFPGRPVRAGPQDS